MKKQSQRTTPITDYYRLTKPGIIKGNLITAAAGFFLASKGNIDFLLLLSTLSGVTLIIASACVINNYVDRKIDFKMARTKNRALVTGKISAKNALIYASVLGLLGFVFLAYYINLITFFLGLTAFINYIIFYGIAKRKSVHGTIIGSISGALPITAGYTAVTNSLDAGAVLLFMILVFWQMPHFYAIAIYRIKDYKAAKIPVLPIVGGLKITKIQMIIYILVFTGTNVLLAMLGYAGIVFLVVMIVAGIWWLWLSSKGFGAPDNNYWAKKMFGLSLIVLMVFSIMISVDSFLP